MRSPGSSQSIPFPGRKKGFTAMAMAREGEAGWLPWGVELYEGAAILADLRLEGLLRQDDHVVVAQSGGRPEEKEGGDPDLRFPHPAALPSFESLHERFPSVLLARPSETRRGKREKAEEERPSFCCRVSGGRPSYCLPKKETLSLIDPI